MAENCNPNDCPIASRVQAVEEENRRAHKEFYERFDRINEHMVRTDERYDRLREDNAEIKESIKENTEAIKALQEKPGKRWDAMVAAIVSAIVGVVVGLLFSGIVHG